jgi:hypothetical protein
MIDYLTCGARSIDRSSSIVVIAPHRPFPTSIVPPPQTHMYTYPSHTLLCFFGGGVWPFRQASNEEVMNTKQLCYQCVPAAVATTNKTTLSSASLSSSFPTLSDPKASPKRFELDLALRCLHLMSLHIFIVVQKG